MKGEREKQHMRGVSMVEIVYRLPKRSVLRSKEDGRTDGAGGGGRTNKILFVPKPSSVKHTSAPQDRPLQSIVLPGTSKNCLEKVLHDSLGRRPHHPTDSNAIFGSESK